MASSCALSRSKEQTCPTLAWAAGSCPPWASISVSICCGRKTRTPTIQDTVSCYCSLTVARRYFRSYALKCDGARKGKSKLRHWRLLIEYYIPCRQQESRSSVETLPCQLSPGVPQGQSTSTLSPLTTKSCSCLRKLKQPKGIAKVFQIVKSRACLRRISVRFMYGHRLSMV